MLARGRAPTEREPFGIVADYKHVAPLGRKAYLFSVPSVNTHSSFS